MVSSVRSAAPERRRKAMSASAYCRVSSRDGIVRRVCRAYRVRSVCLRPWRPCLVGTANVRRVRPPRESHARTSPSSSTTSAPADLDGRVTPGSSRPAALAFPGGLGSIHRSPVHRGRRRRLRRGLRPYGFARWTRRKPLNPQTALNPRRSTTRGRGADPPWTVPRTVLHRGRRRSDRGPHDLPPPGVRRCGGRRRIRRERPRRRRRRG